MSEITLCYKIETSGGDVLVYPRRGLDKCFTVVECQPLVVHRMTIDKLEEVCDITEEQKADMLALFDVTNPKDGRSSDRAIRVIRGVSDRLERKLKEERRKRAAEADERYSLFLEGNDYYLPSELRFAAISRCPCGFGMAYVKECGASNSHWVCSGILMGTADTNIKHSDQLPFAFYNIRSADQPSAGGATTEDVMPPSESAEFIGEEYEKNLRKAATELAERALRAESVLERQECLESARKHRETVYHRAVAHMNALKKSASPIHG